MLGKGGLMSKTGILGALLAGMLALSPVAHSSYLDTILTAGTLNVFEDNDREAFIDVDNSGNVSVGDVLIGFVRIDNKTAPDSFAINNQLYAIFSQQVATVGPVFQTFAPTTVAGLQLSDIVAGADPNGVVAVFSSNAPITNLITTSPGDTLQDYFDVILAGMELDLVAGFREADDFFTAIATIPVTADNNPATGLLALEGTDNAAFYTAGLSILQNFTDFGFAEAVSATNPLAPGSTHQLGISGGTATGASDDPNVNDFADASGFGGGPHNQCQNTGSATNLPCGFRTNADFGVVPIAVPEPGTVLLLGLGLLALAGMRRRLS